MILVFVVAINENWDILHWYSSAGRARFGVLPPFEETVLVESVTTVE
jgi:hypothetical protein